ncbi:Conserved_hypothetical protein [Hexamita inflata]|uniref:Uncharacterized protein n=1 Tax=Hexamita inflata TaxID=28002 RepID=A0AA86UMH4_9EUKA|nr:Conserved hypothetical protein [Hexamita inflata]
MSRHSLINFEQVKQQLQNSRQENILEFELQVTELLNVYPFAFGYFQILITSILDTEDKVFDLITLQLERSKYCRQTWEIYLNFAEKQLQLNNPLFTINALALLYEEALSCIGSEWLSGSFWSRYFIIIKNFDQDYQNQRMYEFLIKPLAVKDFSQFYNNEWYSFTPEQLIQINESYDLNNQNFQFIQELELQIESRSFFHYKPLNKIQFHSIQHLVDHYKSNFKQLIRLYYISFQTEKLRTQIVSHISQITQDEDIIHFLDQHLKSNAHQALTESARFTDFCIHFKLTNEFESFKRFVLSQNNSLQIVSFLNMMKYSGIDVMQFKEEILRNIMFKTQGEAEIINFYSFTTDEVKNNIELFQKKNCDCLVVKLIQLIGVENVEIARFFKGTQYENIIMQEIRKRNWILADCIQNIERI